MAEAMPFQDFQRREFLRKLFGRAVPRLQELMAWLKPCPFKTSNAESFSASCSAAPYLVFKNLWHG